ncbi:MULTISPECIES: universal stress protein [Thalassospira]|uniref:UspA domain-containing protein n=2 Tax=Thalassospira TaxID=168934 RepID=A0AB72U7C3_9PROT|nr:MULTISPECIES: universal stress protein [Thalassospira]AJD50175.1 UspA domain-containing protein [Thalassospira xiamenensis M-5 = DSM 17429]KEO52380.1 universal stress protein UspA [Thalassospira permensis NBRC 106175]SIT27632.1 Nucleotide-binding universal stress protein, UspA family [Thalassospira xiamenensis M-5 = DSM 17429]
MTHLIALIDGSSYSQSVRDLTCWVAERTEASVELMHVLGRRGVGSEPADLSGNLKLGARSALLQELADLDEQKAKLELKRGRLLLEEAKSGLEEAGLSSVTSKLRHGDLIDAIGEFEGDADLIIIGKRGEAADFAKLHLGSNLERVVRSATKPVLVASRAFKPINKFLIAFDGGESAMKAVRHIAGGKLFTGLPCVLLCVGKPTDSLQEKLDDAATILRKAGYDVDAGFEAGEPEDVIKNRIEADGIDLLIMGAYGHSRIRNLIIGSTTTEMVRSCHVPVMMFR